MLRMMRTVTTLFVRPTILSFVIAIATTASVFAQSTTAAGGGAFTLVVKSNGTLWSFGLNSNGQLGINSIVNNKTPIQISGLSSITSVAAGGMHSMALNSSGALYVWGDNQYGQVGNGAAPTDRKTPLLLSLSNVTAIAAGEFHSLALTSNGNVYAWGRNNFGQIGNGGNTTTNVTTPTLVVTGAVAIGAGRTHSLAVKSDGSAWSWGSNGSGQLGNNTTSTGATNLPVQMQGITNAAKVIGGEAHSLIVLTDGTVKGAGENGAGQLGDTTPTDRWIAVTVGALSNVAQVVSGLDHAFARLTDGSLWGWGENTNGELGLGANITDQHAAVQVSSLSNIAAIAAGWNNSISVDTSGAVSTWGMNGSSQLGDGTAIARSTPTPISGAAYDWRVASPVFNLAGGTYNVDKAVTLTVDTASASICYTQNGIDPTQADTCVPTNSAVQIAYTQTLKARAFMSGMPSSEVTSATYTMVVATPTTSSVGVFNDPQHLPTLTFSTGTSGASMYYTTDGVTNPTEASTPYPGSFQLAHTTTFKIVAFRTGWSPSAVKTQLYTMNFGTLSAPVLDPPSGTYVGSVTMTTWTTAPGVVHYTTAIGTGTPGTPFSTSPSASPAQPFTQTTNVRSRSFHPDYSPSVGEVAGTYTIIAHTPTLTASSGEYAPGSTVTISAGEPSLDTLRMTIDGTDPTTTSRLIASGTTIVLGNFTLKVRAFRSNALQSAVATAAYTLNAPLGPGSVTAGGAHTMIATPDGRVYAWGDNGSGQIGNGNVTDVTSPQLLNTITGVVGIAGGLQHTLALTSDGTVHAWGTKGNGRIGDGNLSGSQLLPYHITTLANVIAVAAGDTHSLALTSDGHVWAWGGNAIGQLGLGNTNSAVVPTEISGLANIVAIAAGDSNSFAITNTGQLYGWGSNGSSRLGFPVSVPSSLVPVLIDINDVAAVAPGAAFTLAMKKDGSVWAWGASGVGQGGTFTSTIEQPTQILGLNAIAVTAGDAHSGAIRSDGVVVAWGANLNGQVGNGNAPTNIAVPTPVVGLSAISTISFGDDHSVAVSPSGDVYTWGKGADGRLGSGNINDRSTAQTSLIGLPWALNQPIINPPGGSYTSLQSVTMTTSNPAAIIRYTLDGSTPTDSSTAYSTAFDVNATTTIRARTFGSGATPPSAVTTSAFTFVLGTLQPPLASPTGGIRQPSNVVLTAAEGATIRYTLDGTNPTLSSPLYSAPIPITSGVWTLKAKAFQDAWVDSIVISHTYSIDGVPPTNVASLFPSAIDGWNTTATILTFYCADNLGVASCPIPITASAETDGMLLSGTAVDYAEYQTPAGLIVRIDYTPPTVVITSPNEGADTVDSTRIVTADVADALSGIASVECNGVVATLQGGVATCIVPLRVGLNPVIVVAKDHAGNVASTGRHVYRKLPTDAFTKLMITPNQRTMVVQETQMMNVSYETGFQYPTDVIWASDDPNIVQILPVTQRTPIVLAKATGTVTIHAYAGPLTAVATITVLGGESLPKGTTEWEVRDVGAGPIVYAHAQIPFADLYVNQYDAEEGYSAYALSADGRLKSLEVPPGRLLMGDFAGGLLSVTTKPNSMSMVGDGLVRLRGGENPPWRYESVGGFHSEPAQSPEGYLFVAEWYPGTTVRGDAINDLSIAIIDGLSGALIKRVMVPRSRYTYTEVTSAAAEHACNALPFDLLSNTFNLMVGDNGHAYFTYQDRQVSARMEYVDDQCADVWLKQDTQLKVMELTGEGLLREYVTVTHSAPGCADVPHPNRLLPDGLGGVLATSKTVHNCTLETNNYLVTRIDAGGTVTSFPYPSGLEIAMTGDGNAYLVSSTAPGPVMVKDVATWATRYTTTVNGNPILSTDGGGTVLDTGSVVGPNGAVETSLSLNLLTGSSVAKLGHWTAVFSEGSLGTAVRAFRGDDVVPASQSFTYATSTVSGPRTGNPWNQAQTYQPCEVGWPIALNPDFNSWMTEPILYQFVEAENRTDWTLARRSAVDEAFAMWNQANLRSGLNVHFVKDETDNAPNAALKLTITQFMTGNNQNLQGLWTDDEIVDRVLRRSHIDFAYSDYHGGEVTPEGLRKTALHEIGHSMALRHNDHPGDNVHPYGFNGSSVMNLANGPNDSMGYQPGMITPCDRQRTVDAASRQ